MGHFEIPLTVKVAGIERDGMLDLSPKLSKALFEVELPEGVRIDSVGFGRTIETQGVIDMTCPRCGREFTCDIGHTETHICRSCHDAEIESKVAEGRKNFLAALDQQGIEHQVWNTGGYVMCHAIPLEKDADGYVTRYILFSEVEELGENIGFCYYPSDETVETPNVCWFNPNIKDSDDPEVVSQIIEWFVPMYEQLKAGTIPEGGDEV